MTLYKVNCLGCFQSDLKGVFKIVLEHLDDLGFEYFYLEAEMLEHLETIQDLITNLERLTSDLLIFLGFVLPLSIGIGIGLVAMKTFWDGASRW